MKTVVYITIAVLFAITTAVGCARTAPAAPQVVEVVKEVERVMEEPALGSGAGFTGPETAALAPISERMIMRTVELAVYVRDVKAGFEAIQALTGKIGGYVASANTWHQGEYLRASLTIRIPAKELERTLEQIKALATMVERESTSGEDVTEEYTDLEARLRNLEATEKELLELLKTVRKRTGRAEDILAVHRELTDIRGQIEQIKGRMQYLEQMTALATVHIELTPDVLSRPLTVGRWEPRGTAANAVRALIQVLRFVVDAGIWVAIVGLPVLALIATPITIPVLTIRALRRRAARGA